MEYINIQRVVEATGDIVPGTLGNLCVDVRSSTVTSTQTFQNSPIAHRILDVRRYERVLSGVTQELTTVGFRQG